MTYSKPSWTGHVDSLIRACDLWLSAHLNATTDPEIFRAVVDEACRLSAHSRRLLDDARVSIRSLIDSCPV